MKVILLEDIKGLGRRGDQVKVAAGHARNYLIPNRLALAASGSGARVFAEGERQRARHLQKEKRDAQALAKQFENISVQIAMEVGEEERLFGSVTSADIADRLKEQGMDVDKRRIHLEEPLKQLGVYNVPIRLAPEVEAKVKVWVVKR
jgi:large subunit ribosomal protein L9